MKASYYVTFSSLTFIHSSTHNNLPTFYQSHFYIEVTSGLDSAASYQVVSVLSKIVAQHNLIVICTIHQVSTSCFLVLVASTPLFLGQLIMFCGTKLKLYNPSFVFKMFTRNIISFTSLLANANPPSFVFKLVTNTWN